MRGYERIPLKKRQRKPKEGLRRPRFRRVYLVQPEACVGRRKIRTIFSLSPPDRVDFTALHSSSSSRILLPEAVLAAACFGAALMLATWFNFTERRRQPFGRIKLLLPVLTGVALAIVMSLYEVNHELIPDWMFLPNLLIGMVAGVAAFRLAPSKDFMRFFRRRRSAPSFPAVFDAEPAKIAKLPEKMRRISFYRPEFSESQQVRPRVGHGRR
jgi:hypothetical protein